VTLLVIGCEQNEDDQIMQAQACLDNATAPADAAACKSMISGIYNERANRIRCSLEILGDGITEDTIINAYNAMDDNSQDPVIQVGTSLGLSDIDGDATLFNDNEVVAAQTIKSLCYETDSTGLKTMAQLILFGTQAKFAAFTAGDDPTDPGDIAADIGDMDPTDAGDFAIGVYQLYCVPTFTNNDICTSLQNAGANNSSDPNAVGTALQACLANNTCH
jgi:hypothetical protein